MECRTSDALSKNALDRILELFPEDKDIYENWQKYIQIYAIGYSHAPGTMNDITNYWAPLAMIIILDLEREPVMRCYA